jgi:hypothetical protein
MPFYESDVEELVLRDVQQERLAFADDSGSSARFVERRRCSTSPWIPRERRRICRPLERRGCGRAYVDVLSLPDRDRRISRLT